MATLVKAGEIDPCLDKILASRGFANCPQLQKMLQHIVRRTLEGRTSDLKEFALGVDVFGRPDSYDPKVDAIVRVNARRLRERLEMYYLNGGADDPIRIEIAKGGYVARVVSQARAQQQPVPHAGSAKYRWLWLGIGAVLLSLAPLVAVIHPWNSSRNAEPGAAPMEPLTTLPGQENYPSWSPDGRTFLFTWTGPDDGTPAIYLQKPAEQHPIRLTHSVVAEYRPRWSPDGGRIAFLRRSGATDYLVVAMDRDTARETVYGPVTSSLYSGYVPGLDWAPDGGSLAITEQDSPQLPARVVLWNLRDGRHTPLTNPPANSSGDLEVKFSPDGTRVAVLRDAKINLLVVPLGGGQKEQLVMSNDRAFRGVDWLDNSTLVAGRMGDDETAGLWKIPLGGGKAVRLTPRHAAAESPSFNPRTRQLAYVDATSEVHIWKYSTASGKGEPAIVSTRFDGAPSLSPDERRIAFLSTRSGHLEVWLAGADGSGERCLTNLHGAGYILTPPAWSRDGKLLAIQIRIDGNPDIYLIPAAGGAMRRLTSEASHEYFPSFSQDGRFVYFSSDRTGRLELFRVPVEGGPAVRITYGGALMGWETEGGRGILFIRADRSVEFWRLDFASNRETRLFEETRGAMPVFTCDLQNRRVFYLRQSGSETALAELRKYDFETGSNSRVASFDSVSIAGLPGMAGAGAMGVTADGSFAYLPHITARRSDLMRIDLSQQ